MSELFTSLQIPFTESDKSSVFFAHLQNTFQLLCTSMILPNPTQQPSLLQKINQILFDVYLQHQKLNRQYFNANKNLKEMLTECNQLINQCKADREQLVQVTLDRQAILEKLKKQTDQSLEFVTQNARLCQQIDKYKEINILLTEKNTVLEQQIENVNVTNQGYQKVVKISKQFEKISSDNISIQSDIADILKTTQMYGNASQPLQIMCLAFQQMPNLRDSIWESICEKHRNKFQNITQTKFNFYNFNYIDALMLFSSKKSK